LGPEDDVLAGRNSIYRRYLLRSEETSRGSIGSGEEIVEKEVTW
jgi:hypothetical protein